MSRRQKSAEPSLPLFDLPLQADEGEVAPPPLADAPVGAVPAPPAAEPGQPQLFPAEDLVAADPAALVAPPASTSVDAEDADVDFDGAALLQDRLLAGGADFVAVVVAVGLMVLGSQLLGVQITLDKWQPFVAFGLLFSFPYAVIPLAFWGRTPGMGWVGHTARTLGDEPLTFEQTARRWFGALLTLALAGLPLLLTLGGGRSLADRFSESKTLQER